jgi:hypothetical protein
MLRALSLSTLLLVTGCQKKKPTALTPSTWSGAMVLAGTNYPFEMKVLSVDAKGYFEGTLFWTQQNETGHFRGDADGNHLVFTDDDGDVKDVQLTGTSMGGTDKGGSATFTATLVE